MRFESWVDSLCDTLDMKAALKWPRNCCRRYGAEVGLGSRTYTGGSPDLTTQHAWTAGRDQSYTSKSTADAAECLVPGPSDILKQVAGGYECRFGVPARAESCQWP